MTRKQLKETVVLLAVLLVALSPLLVLLVWPVPDLGFRVRLSGMLLQWAGLGTVIWGLNKRPTAYGMPTWTRAITGAVGRGLEITHNRLPWRRRTVSAVGHVHAWDAVVIGVGEAVVVKKISGLDDRVACLEEEVKRIGGTLSATDQKITKLGAETNERFERERTDSEARIAKIEEKVKKATLGDVWVESTGILFIGIGIAFTSVPTEIVGWMR